MQFLSSWVYYYIPFIEYFVISHYFVSHVIFPSPYPITFWVCEWWITKILNLSYTITQNARSVWRFVYLWRIPGCCHSFTKMAQDNTCSHTIDMNSHRIFMPIRTHPGWLVTQVMFAPACPSYKMLKYTHVDMMFEFFFKGSWRFFVMKNRVK